MDQPTFADLEYQGKKRRTPRSCSWSGWTASSPGGGWRSASGRFIPSRARDAGPTRWRYAASPLCPTVLQSQRTGHGGPPFSRGQALLYEAESVRRFVGLSLSEALPDETTILNFRHLLERHKLGKALFDEINAHLESGGLRLREGSIVDASINEAPSSTKNRTRERDPEMHQTKKGNQWHFGMKAHIGVDSETGVVHSLSTTAANAHDVTEAHNLLHGGERVVWCDAGYQAVHKRSENLGLEIDWQVAMRPGKRRKLDPGCDEALAEKLKASVRAKSLPSTAIGGGTPLPAGEACVRLRQEPALAKAGVRYRGLAKNTERLALLFGLGNLLTAES